MTTKAITDKPFDLENEETPFGKRWGGERVELTEEDMDALKQGKLIAIDVMNEYVVYLKMKEEK